MLQLNKNSLNTIFLTLQCKSQLWNQSGITPYYLFEFISQSTNQTIYLSPLDQSPLCAQTRYQTFNIIETGVTYLSATGYTGNTVYVNLNPSYEWNYNVYEQQYSGNTNINLITSNVPIISLDKGMLFISGYTLGNPYILPTGSGTGTTYYSYANP